MGLHALDKVVANLLENGLDGTTPIAIISNASLPNQQVLTGTLADIVQKQETAQVSAPAIIMVGDVVALYKG